MARSRSFLTRGSPRPSAPPTEVDDWRGDAVVVRLTTKLHAMVAEAGRRSADSAVAIGRQLTQIHDRLAHGQWRRWIDDNASFGRSTAANYMELAAWAERESAEFRRLRHLGPGKLYVLAAVPTARVRKLQPGKLVAIPTTTRRKTVEAMSAKELARVVGDLAPPSAPKVPIEKVVRSVHFKVAALEAATSTMLQRADEVERRDLERVRAEMSAILAELDAALEA